MLRIDACELPPCGAVVSEGGESVSFVGWLGLLRCLSDLVESGRREIADSGLGGELDPGG
jgi:hypothetical protein